ncbi:hypothetical protein [Actinoplanes sp. NPDC049599]|uniref:DUF4760 domain-containing protein n=1 Tax=Actinoplanes sp. NPDC049599 TaxID=3363903 RepID=UPI0037A00E73
MDLGSIQQLIALPTSVTALAVSTAMALRQYRITRSTSRDSHTRTTLMSLNAEFRTDSFQHSLDYVLRHLAADFTPDHGISGLPLEARVHVYRVGHLYGDYGILAVLPTADRELILSYVHGRVLEAWKKLQPYAEQERTRGCGTYWSYFENLAHLAATADKPRILDRLGLRRFDGMGWLESATSPAGGQNNNSRPLRGLPKAASHSAEGVISDCDQVAAVAPESVRRRS